MNKTGTRYCLVAINQKKYVNFARKINKNEIIIHRCLHENRLQNKTNC